MALIEKLKRFLARSGKRSQAQFWEECDKQISALEDRIQVHRDHRRLEGGLASFEAACGDLLAAVSKVPGVEPRDTDASPMRQRVELARQAARIISAEQGNRARLWDDFIKSLAACRDRLHYKTRAKYDRLRLHYESRRHP